MLQHNDVVIDGVWIPLQSLNLQF